MSHLPVFGGVEVEHQRAGRYHRQRQLVDAEAAQRRGGEMSCEAFLGRLLRVYPVV